MLSPLEFSIALTFFIGDVLVIRAYLGSSPERGKKRYPRRSFLIHVLAGVGALLLGALALLAYSCGLDRLGAIAAVGQGLAVAFFAGIFALPMSRHTSGFPGFNLVGYVLYTVAWIASGLLLMWAPGIRSAYVCFVLTHAYLTCRVLVWVVEHGGERLLGRAPRPEPAYSVATTIAALIPLTLAWGTFGVAWHMASVTVAIALQHAGISGPWHANHPRARAVQGRDR